MTCKDWRKFVVAVIGAGTMGSGISQVAAHAGNRVVLIDRGDPELQRGLESIRSSLSKLHRKRQISEDEFESIPSRISLSDDIEDSASADIVIEAVFEDREVKAGVLQAISDVVEPSTIVATNTSSLSVEDLSLTVERSDRFLGIHFFNPVPVLPLVEIVRTSTTSGNASGFAIGFTKHLGKTPILVRDSPGFVVNRLLIPQINGAIQLFEVGVASRDDIDTGMKLGASLPMGPLELADLIGLDVCLSILESLAIGQDDPKLHPAPLLRRMVSAGKLGRKSGEGFYVYE